MSRIIFSGITDVELQGEEVLQVVETNSDFIVFRLIGFSTPIVEIRDYREKSRVALDYALKTGDLKKFPYQFCVASNIIFLEKSNGDIEITMYEPEQINSQSHMLWIAIGIENQVPVYNYLYYLIDQLPSGLNAFLSIYERPTLSIEKGTGSSSLSPLYI